MDDLDQFDYNIIITNDKYFIAHKHYTPQHLSDNDSSAFAQLVIIEL
jgi:hypothetical protein